MAIGLIGGMTVDEASAMGAEHDGKTVHFCVDHGRQKFLSTPAQGIVELGHSGLLEDS